ncbi:MAG: hypothetical protein KGI60_01105 [Patescibacteria group bacterium]|nr:hypothetical protein [Patescibacteria group bacterium]
MGEMRKEERMSKPSGSYETSDRSFYAKCPFQLTEDVTLLTAAYPKSGRIETHLKKGLGVTLVNGQQVLCATKEHGCESGTAVLVFTDENMPPENRGLAGQIIVVPSRLLQIHPDVS